MIETQIPIKQIYSEGKLAFTSRSHARRIQWELKQAGFTYEGENQRIRPGAFGVMWRKVYGHGAYRPTMRTAGNEAAFKAYGAHKKESIYSDVKAVNNLPGRTKVFENVQAEQRKTNEIVYQIFDYLNGLGGYDFTALMRKKEKPIRIATWTAFIHLLYELHPTAKPHQVRRAIKTRYKRAPEARTFEELRKLPYPKGVPAMI